MPEMSPDDETSSSSSPHGDSSLPGERAIAPESQRVYVDAAVNFRAEGGRAATGFVKDLSMTGMFVATDTLYLSGTEIEFSIRVGEILLEGTGRVVWQRAAPSSRGLPIGIGVSFDRLDPDSRANIRELVGGLESAEPAKLNELREAVSAGLDANRDWRPATERDGIRTSVYRAQRNRRDRGGWGIPLASAVVIALLFLFGIGLQNRLEVSQDAAPGPVSVKVSAAGVRDLPPSAPAEPSVDDDALLAAGRSANETATAVAEEAPPASTLLAGSVAASTPGEPAAGDATALDVESVGAAVRSWAAAWAEQDVEGYLASYVTSYAPQSLTHDEWRARRRSRLTAPDVIEVQIEELRIRPEGAGAHATFVQRYRSDQYRDVVRKTLLLEPQAGHWKIRSESSSPL